MALTKVGPEQVHGDTAPSTPATTACTDSPPSTNKKDVPATPQEQQPAHHVMFVVHGMGRQLEEYGNYERNVGHLVENTKAVLQSVFHEVETNVHIIPIEWHAKIHSLVDDRMALASLKTVPKVRMVMNDYLADILYYFNNHFGGIMVQMIVDELNEAYDTFVEKHPDFNGKISVFALSLGGIAMFDILTCQDDDNEEEAEKEDLAGDNNKDDDTNQKTVRSESADTTITRTKMQHGQEESTSIESSSSPQNTAVPGKGTSSPAPVATSATEQSKGTQKSQFGQKCKKSNKGDNVKIRKQDEPKFLRKIPKLKFRPHYLFTVGSPLGAVLVMRNLDWETFHPPDDIIHHNLFHPFDPLGYRIEPLIDPIFAKVPAVLMNSYSSSQGALFSLPSLPSLLLPGSISSFWENKVPTLPRPSIPTLSSLSQMTMSLKAGRWLAGNVNTNTNSSNGSNSNNHNNSGENTAVEDEEDDEDGPAATRNDDEVEQRTGEEVQAISFSSSSGPSGNEHNIKEDPMIMDGDASCTEYIAAATVATCLAPRETGETSTSTSSPADIDTTTGSPSPATLSAKQRPTLGPRRVSSRVDGQHSREHEQRVMADAAEEDMRNVLSGNSNSSSIDESVEDDCTPSLMDMEYYLGTERGATVQEKAQGVGAKSNVVQEPMVQSISSAQGRTKNKEDEDHQQPHADTFPQEIENVEAAKQQEQKKDRTVHVEGKATKLPYRIDYVLQESTADQYTNEYLLGMRSHFRYWGNRDVAYHILRTMLQPVKNLGSEDEVLDLKLTTPVSSTSAANTKGGVEVKTRLPAATARSRSESSASTMMNATTATEAAAAVSSSLSSTSGATTVVPARQRAKKKHHRKSFTFSFFGGYDHSSSSDDDDDDERKRTDNQEEQQRRRRRQQQEETDQNMAMMDEENQLFGYRYPRTETDMDMDMDMSIGSDGKDNSNNSSADTYQRTSSSARPRLVSKTYSVEPSEDVSMASINRGSKRRMSSLTRNRRSIDSKEFEAVVETENKAETKAGVAEKAVGVQGWIPAPVVPELARPAKLHHRSSRV
ncbi:hypothetical protein BX616_003149 [Lobosporangium transversale]|uniref:DDHD domain-containing protein n=1 Tax=Lobosporangium transversale TaxID=64571 RepID=A0A1Y2GZ56_9FUNG|nr:hypothetical protein BCR41DRAFT_383363 [Lobosporangium transversale]KAF9899232.1 hypothetical protein BX616_003149 [Lobosporangium transversale]ORZ27590.1 hypothetical protein BCR41DRAFT_383363 [Lobosporangium transversale]|eukprot:XP_021885293.1 hypothetical protein BCR41DRAFT_383363 [Lobosporangium transversale]